MLACVPVSAFLSPSSPIDKVLAGARTSWHTWRTMGKLVDHLALYSPVIRNCKAIIQT